MQDKVRCDFCEVETIQGQILMETERLRLVVDHAPMIEGHLLIIPKEHYTCYGDVPAALDQELFMLKGLVRQFFEQYYDLPSYWEHGIYRQTVFHAHLHCFPFGVMRYEREKGLHAQEIGSQEELRRWHRDDGQYFYLEDTVRQAQVFEPKDEVYGRVVREVLWPSAAKNKNFQSVTTSQERQVRGVPLIARTIGYWSEFYDKTRI